jgi:hypothetical protein
MVLLLLFVKEKKVLKTAFATLQQREQIPYA